MCWQVRILYVVFPVSTGKVCKKLKIWEVVNPMSKKVHVPPQLALTQKNYEYQDKKKQRFFAAFSYAYFSHIA